MRDRGAMKYNSIPRARCDAAERTESLPADPRMQILRDAADVQFALNPGSSEAPADLIARIRMRLYPRTVREESP